MAEKTKRVAFHSESPDCYGIYYDDDAPECQYCDIAHVCRATCQDEHIDEHGHRRVVKKGMAAYVSRSRGAGSG